MPGTSRSKRSFRAVSQLPWPGKDREVWFFLAKNHEKVSLSGLHRLRNCLACGGLQQVLETRRDALYWRHDGGAKRNILFHDHPSRIVVLLEHAKKRGKINRSLANAFALQLCLRVQLLGGLECLWLSAYIAYDAGGDWSRQARGPHKLSTMRAQRDA